MARRYIFLSDCSMPDVSKPNGRFHGFGRTIRCRLLPWCWRRRLIESGAVLVLVGKPVELGSLPAKWRSGVTPKDEHHRLAAAQRGERHLGLTAAHFQAEPRRQVSAMQRPPLAPASTWFRTARASSPPSAASPSTGSIAGRTFGLHYAVPHAHTTLSFDWLRDY